MNLNLKEKNPNWSGRVKFNCEVCGKETSQRLSNYKKSKGHHFCSHACFGKWSSINMVGNKHRGYIYLRLDGRRVYEHILVAEKALGRKMKRGEVVHHINGDKADNRNCNLLICDKSYHGWLEKKMAQLYKQEHFAHI